MRATSSAGKPHAALFYLDQVLQLERGESFVAQDAAGTHLNAASALGQLRQFEEAISHCRCALAILRNQPDAANSSVPEIEPEQGAHTATDHGRAGGAAGWLGAGHGPMGDMVACEAGRTCLALVRLARLHQKAGNVEAALGAWIR
jgi:tetratricopeptide (TPR) repeat protein